MAFFTSEVNAEEKDNLITKNDKPGLPSLEMQAEADGCSGSFVRPPVRSQHYQLKRLARKTSLAAVIPGLVTCVGCKDAVWGQNWPPGPITWIFYPSHQHLQRTSFGRASSILFAILSAGAAAQLQVVLGKALL